MFNLAFAAMDRRATQPSDAGQKRNTASTPLHRQQTDEVATILFVERDKYPIDGGVLLGHLAVRMLLTCGTTTRVNATVF